ncbi:diguanylate cyclase [Salinisphaera sp. PC39]
MRPAMLFDPERRNRLAVLKALLLITMVGGLLFLGFNFQRGQYLLGTLELLMTVFAGALYVVVGRTANLRRWTLIYLFPFNTVMMVALAVPDTSASVFVWVFIIPLLSYLLLGRVWGFAMSALYLGCALAIFVIKHYADAQLLTPVALSNVVLCAGAIWAFSHVYEISRERSERQLLRMASTDPLTGLPNRARFREVFERELKRIDRQGGTLSLAVFDLDYFKRVNDVHGHDAGDALLRRVGEIFDTRLRATDWVCRMGGEEFCVILPGTDTAQAVVIAEELRRRIEDMAFVHDGVEIPVTVSVGVAELDPAAPYLEALYGEADSRLYRAKARGRNRVEAGQGRFASTGRHA